MNCRFLREAREELDAAVEHDDKQQAGLAFEFLQEVEKTIQTLLPDPASGPSSLTTSVAVVCGDFLTVSPPAFTTSQS